jgi:hypothetical protein
MDDHRTLVIEGEDFFYDLSSGQYVSSINKFTFRSLCILL